MEFLTGVREKKTLDIGQIAQGDYEGRSVKINGSVHNIRAMGEVAFVILRKADGLVQCVYEEGKTDFDRKILKEEAAVEVTGKVALEPRAPHGFEIHIEAVKVLSEPDQVLPLAIHKYKMQASLEARLEMRPVSLRNVRERAKFRIQEGIVRGFRDFLHGQGFTEIHTPKIVARGVN